MRRGPLAGAYPAAAAMVMLSLIPYLALSAALGPITPIIARQVHLGAQGMSVASGMANAGYAVGTILAVLFAQHLPQRRMMILYSAFLVAGSILAATATAPAPYIIGHVLQGLCTSLLLIAALPPLILGQPLSKMRWTAMVLNLVIFGAVAVGPVLGGVEASAHAWRPLFWGVAVVAGAALLLALATFEDAPPANRAAPRDIRAIALAAAGCAAAFYGASELTSHPFVDWMTLGPLLAGLALIVVLVVYQYVAANPILSVRGLTTTIPMAAVVVAVTAAAASVSAVTLVSIELAHRFTPDQAGLYLLPEFGGAAVTAVLFGLLIRRRGLHYFVLGGMISLSAGILLISRLVPASEPLTLIGSALIGLGVGASVAPALFITGYSVPASNLQRVFALLELLRAVAAFMVAPILVHLAMTTGSDPASGIRTALWICLGLSTGGMLTAVGIYWLGGLRPATPRMEEWFSSQRPGSPGGPVPALDSPPLLAAIRSGPRHRHQAQPTRTANGNGHRAPNSPRDAPRAPTGARGGPTPGNGDRPGEGQRAAHLSQDDESRTPHAFGRLLFAYDGSDLAGVAIAEAGRQFGSARDAIVLTAWEPFNVEFLPLEGTKLDAADDEEVRRAAEGVAERGAALANAAGFHAESIAVRAAPSWKGIIDVADDQDASVIVLGSHGRSSLPTAALGSVAAGVAQHSQGTVLIVHRATQGSG